MITLREAMLAAGGSMAALIVVKATVAMALGLLGAWLARRSRAALRHVLLSAAFSMLLVLPLVSTVAPAVGIAVWSVGTTAPAAHVASIPLAGASAAAHVVPVASGLSVSSVLLLMWLAGAAVFLASKAGAWMTGQAVVVDGGATI